MAIAEIRHATDSMFATTYAGFTGEGMKFETQINRKKSIYSSLETACQKVEFQAIKEACIAGLGTGILLVDAALSLLLPFNGIPILIAATVGGGLTAGGLIESRKRVQLRADIKACEYQLRENINQSVEKNMDTSAPLKLAVPGFNFSAN